MVAAGLTPPVPPKPRWRAVALVLLWAAIGAGALLLLAKSVQNSGEFSRLQPWILLLNLIGVIALITLLARKITQLVRDYRALLIIGIAFLGAGGSALSLVFSFGRAALPVTSESERTR